MQKDHFESFLWRWAHIKYLCNLSFYYFQTHRCIPLILNNWNFPQVWTNYYKIKVNRWYAHPCQRTRANSSRFSFSSRRNVKAVHAPRQQLNNCRQRPTSRTSKGILAPVEQRAPLFVTRNKRHHARSFRIEIRTSAYMARHFAVYKGYNDEFGRCLLIKILPGNDPLYSDE